MKPIEILKLRNGDIIAIDPRKVEIDEGDTHTWIGIFNYAECYGSVLHCHCFQGHDGKFYHIRLRNGHSIERVRIATDKEKKELFDLMTSCGYTWDEQEKKIIFPYKQQFF